MHKRQTMRARALVFAVVSASLGLAAQGAFAQSQAYTNQPVDLYAGPSGDYPVVAQLAPSQPVEVMGCVSDYSWCDVALPDLRGWVYADYLNTPYEGTYVPIESYGATIGLPIVAFSLGAYWDSFYRGRPWYNDRARWEHVPPPGRGARPPGGPGGRFAPPGARGPEGYRPPEMGGAPREGGRPPMGEAPRAPIGAAPRGPIGEAPRAPIGEAPRAPIGAAPRAPIGEAPRAPIGEAPRPQMNAAPREAAPAIARPAAPPQIARPAAPPAGGFHPPAGGGARPEAPHGAPQGGHPAEHSGNRENHPQ